MFAGIGLIILGAHFDITSVLVLGILSTVFGVIRWIINFIERTANS